MKLNRYTVQIKHDNGTCKLTVVASSRGRAMHTVATAERCPYKAITILSTVPLQ